MRPGLFAALAWLVDLRGGGVVGGTGQSVGRMPPGVGFAAETERGAEHSAILRLGAAGGVGGRQVASGSGGHQVGRGRGVRRPKPASAAACWTRKVRTSATLLAVASSRTPAAAVAPAGTATFGAACRGCPLRQRCTASKTGRTLQPNEHEDLLRAARREAEQPDHQHLYRNKRPLVERSIAWLVRGGNRRLRFRGIAKNDLWLHHRTAGLNLRRLLNLGLEFHHGTWTVA